MGEGALGGSTSESLSESESEDEDEAEDSSLGSGRGCAFFAVFAGTRTTTWLGVSESDEEPSDEDDSEDETAARRLRFRVRFLAAAGLGCAGAMVKKDEPEDVVNDEENALRGEQKQRKFAARRLRFCLRHSSRLRARPPARRQLVRRLPQSSIHDGQGRWNTWWEWVVLTSFLAECSRLTYILHLVQVLVSSREYIVHTHT